MTLEPDSAIAEEELLRARVYGLLARLLANPPDQDLLQSVARLQGDDSPLGQAIGALAKAAAGASPALIAEEYQDLFIGVGRGELMPYGSYYLTGFLHEKPLAVLRGDLSRLGVALAEDVVEPEDHIALLCETMAGLIAGTFGAPAALAEQQRFFNAHLAPWAARFFTDLDVARSARFYRPVGAIGQRFIEIETTAFAMAT